MTDTLLVTGASGRLGRLTLQRLQDLGAGPLIATSRTPAKIAAASTVAIRAADFDAPETLTQAFQGADRLLLISTDALDGSGRRVRQHAAAIEAARAAGVRHLVYTSFLKATDTPLAFVAADHAATEALLADSAIGHTILRFGFFADMALTTLARVSPDGELASAAGDGRIAYVTPQDCAKAAAAALASDFEGVRVLDITGPVVSSRELVAIAGERRGAPIHLKPITAAQSVASQTANGVPAAMAALFAAIDSGIARGAMDVTSDDYRRLTGRDPTTLAEFLSDKG